MEKKPKGQSPAPTEPTQPFAIQTRGRIGKQPGKKANAAAPHENRALLSKQTAYAPLVLAGIIGGISALVLAAGVGLVCLVVFRETKSPPESEIINNPAQVAGAERPRASAEPNLPATDEANPIAPTDSPPSSSSVAVADPPITTSAETSAPTPIAFSPTPEAKSELRSEPNVAATEPKLAVNDPPPTPAPATEPTVEPIDGFPNAVSLPPLPDSADASAPAAAPVALLPWRLDDTTPPEITFLGGDSALRAARQKFELQPVADNTHQWHVALVAGGSSVNFVSLTAKDGNLVFQWTDEAIKQAAVAKQLANCALSLGSPPRAVALRPAIQGSPLAVDIEKSGITVKWNIGNLPLAKQTFLEVTAVDGFELLRKEPSDPIPLGDSVVIGAGPGEKTPCLLLKLSTSSTTNTVDIRLQTLVKLDGTLEAKPYRRRDLTGLRQQFEREMTRLADEHRVVKRQRPEGPAKLIKEATVERLETELLQATTRIDQARYIVDFMAATSGEAKIHFRLYHQAGETKIDLLKTQTGVATDTEK